MDNSYNDILETLKNNKQSTILKILNTLDKDKKEKLIKQIKTVNFSEMKDLYDKASQKPVILNKKLEHIGYTDEYKLDTATQKLYTELGEETMKNNEYAVVTMAGGQGTRLGHNRSQRYF